MIIELDITKENTYLVSNNSDSQYVIGIGNTDYTIHRSASEIDRIYADSNYFKGWSVKDKNSYHVLRSKIRNIVEDIKFKDSIEYNGKTYSVSNAYVGIANKSKCYLNSKNFGYTPLKFEGDDISEHDSKVKYILEIN